LMTAIKARVQNPVYFAAAIILVFLSVVIATFSRNFSYVTLLMFPLLLPFCFTIMRHGASQKVLLNQENRVTANAIGLFVGFVFFMNCWAPYLGLKTSQSVNMFANIRLEGGVSNHLIMRNAPGPFTYLEDIVEIKKSEGVSRLDYNPDLTVTYMRDGQLYEDMTAQKLANDIETTLHPRWFRKWFHFKQADLAQPEYCTN